MPTEIASDWNDCFKLLPYWDFEGRWQIPMDRTQVRLVCRNGTLIRQYREKPETDDEWKERNQFGWG